MSRIKEFDKPETGLSALVRYQHAGQRHYHEGSRNILQQVEALVPKIASDMFPVHAGVSFEHADRLRLYGDRAERLYNEIAGKNIVATAVLIMAARHGLKAEQLDNAFKRLNKGQRHELGTPSIYTQMLQFVRPEFVGELPMATVNPPARPTLRSVAVDHNNNG